MTICDISIKRNNLNWRGGGGGGGGDKPCSDPSLLDGQTFPMTICGISLKRNNLTWRGKKKPVAIAI